MKSIAEYRQTARGNLQGKWGAAVGATLLYGLIVGGLSAFGIGLIIAGPLSVGLALFFLRLTRKGNPEVNSLFEPFNNFLNAFVMSLLKGIFIALWSLLFVIPGIVKSYSYAMSEYIMADDPSVDGMKAIDISKKMMDGKKGKLFSLQLSIMWLAIIAYILLFVGFGLVLAEYISWHSSVAVLSRMWVGMAITLISAFAMIPISLFLTPYYYAAQAAFYEDAKAEYFQSRGNVYAGNNSQNNQYGQQSGGQQGSPPYNQNYYGQNQYYGNNPNQQGSYYNPDQQSGYNNPNQQGGYNNSNQQSGYYDPGQPGGYNSPGRQDGYNPDRQGGSIYKRFYGEDESGDDNRSVRRKDEDDNGNNNNPPPNPF